MSRPVAYHAPVLAGEVVELFRSAKTVLDGTLGGGGHALALLEAGVPLVLGVDRDPEAIAAARSRLEVFERAGRFQAFQTTFDAIDSVAELADREFDAALLDLGVSSRQLDAHERGFSFREGAPLDMRMAGSGARARDERTAADLLNETDERELARIFREYGDEKRAGRLAREIVRRRGRESFATSDHLVRAIRGALGARTGPSDFARLFQAVRIAVNDELDRLARALPLLRDHVRVGGILAAITYHSGEDRLVKQTFREWSADCVCPPKQPMCTCRGHPLGKTLTRRAVAPTPEEVARNPRARSARLRAWQRGPAKASRDDAERR